MTTSPLAGHPPVPMQYTHTSFFMFGKVKMENAKRIFIISAISLALILSIGMYLHSSFALSYSWSIPLTIGIIGSTCLCLDSYSSLAKAYDIAPSCFYKYFPAS